MNNTFFLIRHAETKKEPSSHSMKWELTDSGKEEARRLANLSALQNVDLIYASKEAKTRLTIEPLANRLSKIIHIDPAFNEVNRPSLFLTNEEFTREKQRQLEDWAYAAQGGESANEALARFKIGIDRLNATLSGKEIVIVSHGTILNIYFAFLIGTKDIFKRWSNTSFCAYGIVRDGKVVEDLV